MKRKTAVAAMILVSVIISSCTTKGEKKTVAAASDQKNGKNLPAVASSQSLKLKMQKGKCCSSSMPSRFPVKEQ